MRLFHAWMLSLALLISHIAVAAAAEPKRATENVILFMTDGLRWQEVFGGAEEALLTKDNGGVKDVDALKADFWRDTPEARREALMPFLWSVVAKQGQIYGNPAKGSRAAVTNGMKFSYPGYNETLCGFADPRIDSNDKKPNPNITVFEWLNRKPAYHGRVAAFGVWDVFPYIFNTERCGFMVNAGWDPLLLSTSTPRIDMLNAMKSESTRYWKAEPFDAVTMFTAIEYLKEAKPRVMFLSINETDGWGHAGRYDLYLEAARRADNCLKMLWETTQSMPEYKGKTSIVFLPDHGRGDAPVEWKNHGQKTPKSEYIWMAYLGPDTPPLGERSNVPEVTQSQTAATVAALLGEDYAGTVPQVAEPIADVIGPVQSASR